MTTDGMLNHHRRIDTTEMRTQRKNVYGHDMLYVTAHDGTKVGRVNLKTGRVTMDLPELRPTFDRVVDGWRSANLAAPADDTPVSLVVPPTSVDPDPRVAPSASAGASAQREYDRRSSRELARKQQRVADDARWREEVKAEHPLMGRVASAFTAKPKVGPESQSTRAWKVGAEGERRVAEVLTGVGGIAVLHDRRIPGSRANIDHLVVGPAGVFVVDAKKHQGRVEARDVGGFLRLDMRLYVKGRDRTKLVDGVQWQVEVVEDVLRDRYPHVGVHGVLCFIGSDWGLVMRRQKVRGVVSLWPKALPGHVTRRGPLTAEVGDIARYLEQHLRPAG